MNTTAPPLDDPRVRQALLHAVDRRAVVDHILEGAALPVRSVIAPGVFGFKDMEIERLYPFDRTRARALLGQAGWAPGPDGMLWKDGRPLRLDFLATRGRHPKDREVTEALQAMLREVGVDAAVEFRDWAAQFQEVRAEPFRRHLFTWGWLTLTADADYGLYGPFHSKQPASGGNTARYANPQVDRLLDRARQSLDQAERLRLYGEVQDILAHDMVWLPMYAGKEIVVTRAHVKGFAPHPLEYTLDLRRTRLER
jgi:peptide/nickel transport system substrate-binding protein